MRALQQQQQRASTAATSRPTAVPCVALCPSRLPVRAAAFTALASRVQQEQNCSSSSRPSRSPKLVCRAQSEATAASATGSSRFSGKCISSTEVPAFIMRDDMMDQLHQWALIEADEAGLRNFGMPMKVQAVYQVETGDKWGFDVEIIKEGVLQTRIGVGMDDCNLSKHEWVGKDKEGFPTQEGKAADVLGKNFEIWWVVVVGCCCCCVGAGVWGGAKCA